jgi:hypothetical protein
MNILDIVFSFQNKKAGTFQRVVIARECKTFKGCSHTVSKRETLQRLHNVNYANRSAVSYGVSMGLRETPHLPEWAEQFHTNGVRFIRHKGNGQVYLPLDIEGMEPRVQWFLDGQECDFASVEPYLLASEKQEKPSKAELHANHWERHIRVKIENIEDLG